MVGTSSEFRKFWKEETVQAGQENLEDSVCMRNNKIQNYDRKIKGVKASVFSVENSSFVRETEIKKSVEETRMKLNEIDNLLVSGDYDDYQYTNLNKILDRALYSIRPVTQSTTDNKYLKFENYPLKKMLIKITVR